MRLSALVAGLFLALCSCQQPAKAPVTLRIGLYSTQDYLPYFVMKEQGFDKRHGLELQEMTPFTGGAAIIESMVAGKLDVGIVGSVPVIAAAEQGLVPARVVIVAGNNVADAGHPGAGLLVGPAVTAWKDLEGQFIAVNATNSILATAIKGRLKMEGVRKYTLSEISFSNMGLAVAGGNVAAATMYEPFLTQSLLRGDGKLFDFIIGGEPFPTMQNTLVAFSAETHRQSPQAVKAFLRAHLDAVAWIGRNPDAARTLLAKHLQLSPEVGRQVRLLRWPPDARTDASSLEQVQTVMLDVGMLKSRVPMRDLCDETLLRELLAERR